MEILIVGGGYIGMYTARRLERLLRRGEATVTVVDPRGYMTYQPFLAEAAGGSVEPRHVIAPLPRVLRHTRVLTGKIVSIDHASRLAVFAPARGPERVLRYDVLVMAAGSVSRVLPVEGLAEYGAGFKTVSEAVHLRLPPVLGTDPQPQGTSARGLDARPVLPPRDRPAHLPGAPRRRLPRRPPRRLSLIEQVVWAEAVNCGPERGHADRIPGERRNGQRIADPGAGPPRLTSRPGSGIKEDAVSVYRVIDVIGTSTQSWEDAAVTAVNTARKSLRDLRVAEVVEQDLQVEDGGGVVFRTKLRLSFKYEDPE